MDLVIGKAKLEVGEEAVHVLGEASAGGVGEGANRQHGLFMHPLLPLGRKHRQQGLHDGVRVVHDHRLGRIAITQLLHDDLQHATQQPLQPTSMPV